MAWTRTSLAVLANGALLLLRDAHGNFTVLGLFTAGAATALALLTYLIGFRRQRLLARVPLPAQISPRREVYFLGMSVVVLIAISAVSLMV